MEILFQPVVASRPHTSFDALRMALEAMDSATVKAAFAYATIGGVEALIDAVNGSLAWAPARKEFLIGVHHAITEPQALDALSALGNSQVRLYLPDNRIEPRAFEATPVFHPKVLGLTDRGSLRFLQAGSANLTHAALGLRPYNHEFGMVVRANAARALDSAGLFQEWWHELWSRARAATPPLITKYAELRLSVIQENPILLTGLQVPSGIAHAQNFFIEVGAGSGPPGARHQVEFPESLVRFFGRLTRAKRTLTLRRGKKEWRERPLSFKTTTYGVGIWRLGMPTQAKGGPPVARRAVFFSRTSRRGIFEFQVADVSDKQYADWVKVANQCGHLGSTGGRGGRRYGFF